jgi:hypothetical protein
MGCCGGGRECAGVADAVDEGALLAAGAADVFVEALVEVSAGGVAEASGVGATAALAA